MRVQLAAIRATSWRRTPRSDSLPSSRRPPPTSRRRSRSGRRGADPQIDVRVAGDLRIVKRRRRHERIVLSGDDERRHADAIDHAHRAGAVIVVLGAAEAEVRRRVGFVELAHRLDRVQLREIVKARVALLLAPHPPLQVAHEIPLIQPVAGPLERARALADFDDRRHRGDADQRCGRVARRTRRRASAPGCRRASSRRRRSPADPVDRHQFVDDVRGVGGQAGMEQPFREMLRVAAVALVQAHDVHAARERLRRRGRACSAPRSIRSGRAARSSVACVHGCACQ